MPCEYLRIFLQYFFIAPLRIQLVLNPLNQQTRVNSTTGERTYCFFEGNSVSASSANSQVVSTASDGTVFFTAHGTHNLVHAVNTAPSAAPLIMHPGGAAMAPLPCYQTVVTLATPATERGIKIGGREEYYVRPSYKKGSWMWK